MQFSDAVLRPPAVDKVFEKTIKHPDVYIWDAWVLPKKGDPNLYLYALASPREVFKEGSGVDIQTQRDHIPHHHRLFISKDQGATWKDHGAAFYPNPDKSAFDGRSIWTGSAVEYQGKVVGGYTGIRQTDEAHPFIQGVGLSVSEDGGLTYHRITQDALSCPIRDYDAIRQAGYYLGPKDDLGTGDGEEGGCILAWRDPGLIVDPATGHLHAFWSAKTLTGTKQNAAVAHGIVYDVLTKPRLELQPPVILPDAAEYTQAEVPQLLYSEKHKLFYMTVSTCDRTSNDQTDKDLNLNGRLYVSDSLNGPWEYAGHLINKVDKRYPASLVSLQDTDDGCIIQFMAPYNRSNGEEIMHTMPAVNRAVIKNRKVVEVL